MLRLGLVCDFAEEGWASMDLVADMLFEHLQRGHGHTIHADRLRPALRRRATAFGMLRSSRAAWNGDRLWNRMVEYPVWLEKRVRNYDLFHIVDGSYSQLALLLPPGRTVITCHDLNAFRCLLEPKSDPRPLWFRMMARRILHGLKSARHVIFVSEAVQQEAAHYGIVSKSRSSVIYNGAVYDGDADPGSDRDAEREAYGLLPSHPGELLLLSVGSTVARKRIDDLLRVFAGIARDFPGVKLIRAGGVFTASQVQLAHQLGIAQSIVELPFVRRAVLEAVYRRATLLLQPSDGEGFGLPVAEAMAQSCPVLASDLPALREVGGEAAHYCSAGDTHGWIKSVSHLLNQSCLDPVAWSKLRARSRDNARRFSWRVNAERVASLYQSITEETQTSRPGNVAAKPAVAASGEVSSPLVKESNTDYQESLNCCSIS